MSVYYQRPCRCARASTTKRDSRLDGIVSIFVMKLRIGFVRAEHFYDMHEHVRMSVRRDTHPHICFAVSGFLAFRSACVSAHRFKIHVANASARAW